MNQDPTTLLEQVQNKGEFLAESKWAPYVEGLDGTYTPQAEAITCWCKVASAKGLTPLHPANARTPRHAPRGWLVFKWCPTAGDALSGLE